MSGRCWRLLAAILPALSAGACAPRGEAARSESQPAPLDMLGRGASVRIAADSWAELVARTRPTFTWGQGDMMWVGRDAKGKLQFTLDRAWRYRPKGASVKWVLISLKPASPWSPGYARGAARLYNKVPMHDRGAGEYAVVRAAHPRHGTVYEVGWQWSAYGGISNHTEERRLYVMQDAAGKWQFIGEGPRESGGKTGCDHVIQHERHVKAAVEWTGRRSAPVRVRFTVTCLDHEWYTAHALAGKPPPPPPRRNRVEHREAVLEGRLPAKLRWAAKRPYLLAGKGDTFEGIVRHLASWTIGWMRNRGDDRKHILQMWRNALIRLNPRLPRGAIPEGTRIRVLSYLQCCEELRRLREKNSPSRNCPWCPPVVRRHFVRRPESPRSGSAQPVSISLIYNLFEY